MAAEAGSCDPAVIEGGGDPAAGLVAVFAGVVCCEVGRALAGGLGSVVVVKGEDLIN